jgi:hypothetical protein
MNLMPALFTTFWVIAQTTVATAEDPANCHRFQLIERTDIVGRAAPSPDSVPTRNICVPPGYFRPWQGRREAITDLSITAKWPSMESIWDKPLPGKNYDPVTHGNFLNIWFGFSTSYPSVDYRFHATRRILKADLPGSPEFGLQHLVPDPTNPRPEAELYFKPENVHSSYIACTVPSYAPSPGCNEEFEFHGYLISVHYSHVFLPDWQDVQKKVERLILSFENDK